MALRSTSPLPRSISIRRTGLGDLFFHRRFQVFEGAILDTTRLSLGLWVLWVLWLGVDAESVGQAVVIIE